MDFWGDPNTWHRAVATIITIFGTIIAVMLMIEGWRSVRRK